MSITQNIILLNKHIMEQTYYEILEVKTTATQDEIKTSWKRLSREYHPDKAKQENLATCETKIKLINEAYTVLSDPNKRDNYDKYGKEGAPKMPTFTQQPTNNIQPIKEVILISLEESYFGTKVKKVINKQGKCRVCDGFGTKNKTKSICAKCNGVGAIIIMIPIGPNMAQQVHAQCDVCRGKKCTINPHNICNKCNGTTCETEELTFNIEISPGSCHNDKIVINDQGNFSNGKNGQIIFIIQEKEHDVFKRYFNIPSVKTCADDLLIIIDIPLVDALCGFTKEITTISGKKVTLYETQVIMDTDIKVLSNHGMINKKTKKCGNLFIQYKIQYPESLSAEQKNKLCEALTSKPYIDPINDLPDNFCETKKLTECVFNDYHEDNEEQHQSHGQRMECNQQ